MTTRRLKAPWVVKIGGRVLDEPGLRHKLAQACATMRQPLVIVHGGGAQVTRLQEQLGGTPRFVNGKRVTAPDDVRLVEMALSAEVSKALVRDLLSAGCKAIGLSGVDAALVRCTLVPELGAVGVPAQVDATTLQALLATGLTLTLSPVSLGPNGEALNVNADDVACAVAMALKAEALLLVSDVPGVRVGNAVAPHIGLDAAEQLINSGDITGGMIPKVRAAIAAVQAGVGEVRITGLCDGPLTTWSGTCVSQPGRGTAQRSVSPKESVHVA